MTSSSSDCDVDCIGMFPGKVVVLVMESSFFSVGSIGVSSSGGVLVKSR